MPVIGIDLGTTNSLVYAWIDGSAHPIPNALGNTMTPSVISFDDKHKDIVIGEAAKQRMVSHPQHTASCFKRAIGTNNLFKLGSKWFSPIELSALMLKQLKADAEEFLNEQVTEAIISVPAYFSNAQRAATKQAAELAGIQVERLVNEPTAAALAYGVNDKKDENLFMVIDLGGGTLDVSILEVFDDVIEVRASSGDNFLGGEDFALTLYEFFIEDNKLNKNKLKPEEKAQLTSKIEILKHKLSAQHSATIEVRLGQKDYTWECTREQFEQKIVSLIQRFNLPVERALRDSKIQVNELSEVVLVGGATRMPWVRTEIVKLFRRLPSSHLDPDHVVAMGAAVQAALKSRNAAFEDVVLTDVCPFTLGVDIAVEKGSNQHESGHFLPIIERNTTVPVSREKRLFTVMDNQTQLVCDIYQGESRLTKNNLLIGSISTVVPKAKAGEQFVDLRFTYNINGILEALVTIGSSGETKRAIINNSATQLSPKEIDESFKKLESLKIHPRETAKNRELIARIERLYEESLGENRDYLASLLLQFEQALNTQDPSVSEKIRAEIASVIEQFNK